MLGQLGKNVPLCVRMEHVAGPYELREPKQFQPGVVIDPAPIEIRTSSIKFQIIERMWLLRILPRIVAYRELSFLPAGHVAV